MPDPKNEPKNDKSEVVHPLLLLQKTKRMNFSAEVAPEAILRPSWEGPGSILGLILAISVVFWVPF